MNRHNLNIQITTDPNAVVGQKNPAECYAELVLDDAKTGFQKYRWELIPNKGHPAAPTFLIIDDEQGLVSHLSKGESDGKFAKFTMTTTGADGCIVYSSMEMVSPEEPDSVLRDIYVCRADYVMEQETGKAAAPEPTLLILPFIFPRRWSIAPADPPSIPSISVLVYKLSAVTLPLSSTSNFPSAPFILPPSVIAAFTLSYV